MNIQPIKENWGSFLLTFVLLVLGAGFFLFSKPCLANSIFSLGLVIGGIIYAIKMAQILYKKEAASETNRSETSND
jgi:hypothetical protein